VNIFKETSIVTDLKDLKTLRKIEIFSLGLKYQVINFEEIIGSYCFYNNKKGNVVNCYISFSPRDNETKYILNVLVDPEETYFSIPLQDIVYNYLITPTIKLTISDNIIEMIKESIKKLAYKEMIKLKKLISLGEVVNTYTMRKIPALAENFGYDYTLHYMNIEEDISKIYIFLWNYYSNKAIELSNNYSKNDQVNRSKILSFKNGKRFEKVAKRISNLIKIYLYSELLGEIYFVPIPASNEYEHKKRFDKFCNTVSNISGIKNGNGMIKNIKNRKKSHLEGKKEFSVENLRVNNINGKKIILFDDIITTGNQFRQVTRKVEAMGGKVIMGMFLGKTIRIVN